MKISLEWLSELLPGPIDANAAAEAFTYGGLPVESIERIGDDTVLDVEVTSNRGDCLSHLGLARELAALINRPLAAKVGLYPYAPVGRGAESSGAASAASVTSVAIETLELCPHYTARIIRNVKIGPSPAWLLRRLEAVGLRAINNVVDVTNYVMFEMGQPLHAFDFDRIAGRKIVVRKALPGEKIVSIDGHERQLEPHMLVIADAEKPVALAGVMGGLHSEVSDRTTNVLLESARFEPLSVRKTARALTMHSDSSYRFERQIDPTLPERASFRAAQLIVEIAGGELLGGVVEAGQSGFVSRKLSLRLSKLRAVLGTDLPTEKVIDALKRLGLAPVHAGERIDVTVPSHRLDLNIEVDLVEEVARVIGYDKIPVRQEISIRVAPSRPDAKAAEMIRSVLVAAGCFEAVTYSFVSDLLAADFVPTGAASLPRAEAITRKADANLRPSLLPGLLEAVRRNESVGTPGARLYEIGPAFWNDDKGALREQRRLGIVAGQTVRDIRGIVESLLARLDAERTVSVIGDTRPGFAPGACGRIEWGGMTVGHLGLVSPAVAGKLSLRQSPAMAELDLQPLLAGTQHVPQLRPLPRFPAVRRDVSLIVAEAVRFEQIESLLNSLKLADLEACEYVTTYRGKPLDSGVKSVTVTLVFRSPNTTLTSEQVEGSVQEFVAESREKLAATLRV